MRHSPAASPRPVARLALALALALTLALALAGAGTPVAAQRPAPDSAAVRDVAARHVTREVRVRMRDGTALFTAIYAPRDTTRSYPILLMRTPYGVLWQRRAIWRHVKDVRPAVLSVGGWRDWRTFDAWPPREARPTSFYLGAGGRLTTAAPATAGADTYVSDPAKPVPYTQALSLGYWRDYPTEDQRFASRRPDVLTYRTEPLAEDLTIAGPIGVTLHLATTGTDGDVVVKVVDVHPDGAPAQLPDGPRMDGYEQLVFGNVFRLRWRRGFERSVPMVAGRADSVAFALEDVMHTFRRGHRLEVQVQSTWFPLIDRNPQTFVPNIYGAVESDFRPATFSIYRSAARPSRLTVGVLP